MLIALWVVSGITAAAFLAAGAVKLTRPREALVTSGMAWAEDVPSPAIKLLATAEVLGALGLVLPLATGIAVLLAPVAGLALTVLMIGAIGVHVRRRESFAPALTLGLLALVSAVLGFAVLL